MATSLLHTIPTPTFAPGRVNTSVHPYIAISTVVASLDTQFGGAFKVIGTAKVSGTPDIPVRRFVGLFHERSRRIVRSVWSDAAGSYAFYNVSQGPWSVVSWDHTNEYNAVIAANIFGVPM